VDNDVTEASFMGCSDRHAILPASEALLLSSGVQAGAESASLTGDERRHMPGRSEGNEMRGSLRALAGGDVGGGSIGLDP